MASLAFTLMDVPARRGDRVAWADIAKAFSMILLVAYTLWDHRIYLNEMLIFVRMPLFFFVSGLFGYRVVTATSFKALMRDKVTNFVYLYVLWECILYVFIKLVSFNVQGYPPPENLRMLSLLWNPLFNIWFLYALALAFLAAWCLRRAPAWAVLAGSLVLYSASVATDAWTGLPFLERLVRLFPFFWLGLMFGPLVFDLVERHWRLWPAALGAVPRRRLVRLPERLEPRRAAHDRGLADRGRGLRAARPPRLDHSRSSRAGSAYIGGSTLYIYVMHKLVIFYTELAMSLTGTHFRGEEIVQLALTVPLCAVLGRRIAAQPALAWLFTAPWVGERPRRAEPQPMLAE